MFFTIVSTFLKLVLIVVVLALELSVAIPVVAMTLLFMYLRDLDTISKTVLLLGTALVVSSFTGVAWSIIFALLAVSELAIEVSKSAKTQLRNRILLVSIAVTVVLSWLAGIAFSPRTLIYTIIFSIIAFVLIRTFLQQRARHRFIEWISPGK